MTGVGWVYQYVLESDSLDLAQLRTLRDWYIRYQLTSVPGVSEVATLGGFEKQYQVEIDDIRNVAVGATPSGTPIRVDDVAPVSRGPAPRRGVADLNGKGEVVAGIGVMRFGADAYSTIEAIKERVEEIQEGLPPGVRIRAVYDPSDLIERAIDTLTEKLIEERSSRSSSSCTSVRRWLRSSRCRWAS